jgi:hypothetical protein
MKVSTSPSGNNLVLWKPGSLRSTTDDAVRIAGRIELHDPLRTMGAELTNKSAPRPTLAARPRSDRGVQAPWACRSPARSFLPPASVGL